MQRLFDLIFSLAVLFLFFPFILLALLVVWFQDQINPFFCSNRIGKCGKPFRMFKVRTMILGADKSGVDSTKKSDPRITPVGNIIRGLKIDELTQFINVLAGDMSVVGPRPNVQRETDIYTAAESALLSVKPGVTDLSSIVFFDLAQILENHGDANIAYNQLVRPWKSRLGLLYISNKSLWLDVQIITLTVLSFAYRAGALRYCAQLVEKLGGDEILVQVCSRKSDLFPYPPPGSSEIVASREPVQQL